jgi:hypothetical protein
MNIEAFQLHDRPACPPTIVFWTEGPRFNLLTDFLLDGLETAELRGELSLKVLLNLYSLILTRGFPKTLLIVNVEALPPPLPQDNHIYLVDGYREPVNDNVGDGTGSTPVKSWARWWLSLTLKASGVILDLKDRRTRSISTSSLLDLPARSKTSQQLKQAKFEFMTMQEYLTTYDWTGEFTPEEVAPWLNPGAEEANVEET